MTRGEKVIAFIEAYCLVPEGKSVARPMRLLEFQRRFIRDVYDNPRGTSRAYLSVARKNGKSALIAALVLAHLVGPEARQNAQIISGARSRDQASLVFKLAEKMVRLSPKLSRLTRIVPSSKTLLGLAANVEYRAISAEAGTAHGLSPVLAILDEVGQVKGPHDAFVEAVETAQGAHDDPLLIAISTQAATDADLFSLWLDGAAESPRIVSHVYSAPEDCALDDEAAWRAANPALGVFRSEQDMRDFAEQAKVLPAKENSFRWLYLNQRISADAPFIAREVWIRNGAAPAEFAGRDVWGGLDLAQRNDMSALVWVADGQTLDVEPHFWLPQDGIRERGEAERVPFREWWEMGFLHTSPGTTINYRDIAQQIIDARAKWNVRSIAYDPNMAQALWPHLEDLGMSTEEIEALFHKVTQGYAGMSPCIAELQALLLEGRMRHGAHPVLTWHAQNAVLLRGRVSDQFLLAKPRGGDTRRIDGMVALAMAVGRRAMMMENESTLVSPWDDEDFRLVVG